ncbi:ATP synthase subunit alpha (ATP synthase F1 sector subunit alpha) (F-ATPase subunit alpha), partial [Durusdinium trenchii]
AWAGIGTETEEVVVQHGEVLRLAPDDLVASASAPQACKTVSVDEFLRQTKPAESGEAVFRAQPRDLDRETITEGWNVGIPTVDALTPLGRGQSMLFCSPYVAQAAEHRDTLLLQILGGMLGSPLNGDVHCWIKTERTPQAHKSGMRTSDVFDFASVDRALAALPGKVSERVTLVHSEASRWEDAEVVSVLASYISCSLAERRSGSGGHALLALPSLQAHYRVWRRAQRLAAAYYVQHAGGRLPPGLFGAGADRAELRQFYSSLVQRSANLNEKCGGGSLSCLHGVFQGSQPSNAAGITSEASEDEERGFELHELVSLSASELNRAKLLRDRGIKLTRSVLTKLGFKIPQTDAPGEAPALDASKYMEDLDNNPVDESTLTQHAEELKSISDGHIVTTWDGAFDFDITNSLTRIGIGINRNKSRDTRPFALRKVAGPLRLELCQLADSDPAAVAHYARHIGRFADAVLLQGARLSLVQEVIILTMLHMDVLAHPAKLAPRSLAQVHAIESELDPALKRAIESNSKEDVDVAPIRKAVAANK